jgi:hypothetical protein
MARYVKTGRLPGRPRKSRPYQDALPTFFTMFGALAGRSFGPRRTSKSSAAYAATRG